MNMFFLLAGIIFLLAGLMHLIRVFTGWSLKLGVAFIPIWLSLAISALALIMSYFGFKFYKK